MLAVEIVIVIAVVFTVAALAVGRFDRMDPAVPDSSSVGLPQSGAVTAADVARTRFAVALRGYHMAEVDAVLLRLAEELSWRDDEIARRDEELVRLASFARIGTTQDVPATPATPSTADTRSTVSARSASGLRGGSDSANESRDDPSPSEVDQ